MSNAFGTDQQIEFPVSYDLKVFFEVKSKEDRHVTGLQAVLGEMGIKYGDYSIKESGKGKFISVSIPVTVPDRPSYDKLYKRLNALDGIKGAI